LETAGRCSGVWARFARTPPRPPRSARQSRASLADSFCCDPGLIRTGDLRFFRKPPGAVSGVWLASLAHPRAPLAPRGKARASLADSFRCDPGLIRTATYGFRNRRALIGVWLALLAHPRRPPRSARKAALRSPIHFVVTRPDSNRRPTVLGNRRALYRGCGSLRSHTPGAPLAPRGQSRASLARFISF